MGFLVAIMIYVIVLAIFIVVGLILLLDTLKNYKGYRKKKTNTIVKNKNIKYNHK